MTPCVSRSAFIALIICLALPAWSQPYLLYAPQPAATDKKVLPQDGILVQEIEVQKGDTLYDLSRKFTGHGTYFPQILLFNSIKNPDLIYPGNTLKVPVTQKTATDSDRVETKSTVITHISKSAGDKKAPAKTTLAPVPIKTSGSTVTQRPSAELSLSDLKPVAAEKIRVVRHKKTAAVRVNKKPTPVSSATAPKQLPLPAAHKKAAAVPPSDTATGQKLFESAVKAYRRDDCRTALTLLDRYLSDNATSPLAADAQLYKAECYLKLSTQ